MKLLMFIYHLQGLVNFSDTKRQPIVCFPVRRMKIMKKALNLFFSLAFFSILMSLGSYVAMAQGQYTEEIHKNFTIPSDGRISLENINGDVRVQGWDRNEVKVDA